MYTELLELLELLEAQLISMCSDVLFRNHIS